MIILDDQVETASKHTPIKAIEIQGFGDAWLESQSKTVEKWSYLVSQKRIRGNVTVFIHFLAEGLRYAFKPTQE